MAGAEILWVSMQTATKRALREVLCLHRPRLSSVGRTDQGDGALAALLDFNPWVSSSLFLWCSLEMVVTVEQDLKQSG